MHGPHIKTTYLPDGSLKREPSGFGGELCHAATRPYDALQKPSSSEPTAEAAERPYLETGEDEQRYEQA